MSSKVIAPDASAARAASKYSDRRLVDQRDPALGARVQQPRPALLAAVVVAEHADVVAERVEVVDGRQHRDVAAGIGAQRVARLHVELLHRRIAMPLPAMPADAAALGEVADIIPFLEALGVERLQRAPEPDDVEVVETLVVEVVGARLQSSLALAGNEIEDLVFDLEAEIRLGHGDDLVDDGDRCSQHAQRRRPENGGRRDGLGLSWVHARQIAYSPRLSTMRRPRAIVGAWNQFLPASCPCTPGRHGHGSISLLTPRRGSKSEITRKMNSEQSKAEQVEQLLDTPDLAGALESEQFKKFLDQVPIAICVSQLAGDERIVYANPEFEKLSGLDRRRPRRPGVGRAQRRGAGQAEGAFVRRRRRRGPGLCRHLQDAKAGPGAGHRRRLLERHRKRRRNALLQARRPGRRDRPQ